MGRCCTFQKPFSYSLGRPSECLKLTVPENNGFGLKCHAANRGDNFSSEIRFEIP
jgi:hypothetical protein